MAKEFNRVATVAERLKIAMDEAGKKQIDLIRETGLDRGAVSKYVAGSYEPKQKAVTLLASALDVDEMWLWGYDVPKARVQGEKKNDDLVKVIAQLRKDSEFLEVVSMMADLPAEQYASIKTILSALGKK